MEVSTTISRYITELENDSGLKGTDIANLTSVSKATVSRWKSGAARPKPDNELILADLSYVVHRLLEYYNRDEVRLWLYAKHPQLDNERALDLIHEGRAKEVLQIIGRLDSEAYI